MSLFPIIKLQNLIPYPWSVPFIPIPNYVLSLKQYHWSVYFIQSKITRLKSLSLECPFYPIIKLQNLISTCCCSAANSTESQPGTILPIADFYYCKIQLIWNLATAGINYGTHHHVLSFNLPSSIPVPVSYLLSLNDGNAPIKNTTHNVNRIWLQMGGGHFFIRTYLQQDISYTGHFLYSGLGIRSFQKNVPIFVSFPFFIKELSDLCILFRSL